MLLLGLDGLSVSARRLELMELAAVAETVRQTFGSRSATNYLLNGIGLHPSVNYNESYFSGALDYHLAMLYAHLDQPERASEYIERIRLPPSGGGDVLFSDHLRDALELHRQMMEARQAGMPSIVITSMPRSASATLTHSLAATTKLPILRVSAGHYPSCHVFRHWLNSVSPGGAVTHDHFGASLFNLKALQEAGLRDIFILARDPRAAAASSLMEYTKISNENLSAAYLEKRLINGVMESYYPWLANWITAQGVSTLRMHWLKTTEIKSDLRGLIVRILETFLGDYPSVAAARDTIVEVKANFVTGSDEAWRSLVSRAGQEYLWQALPPKAAELLDLQP